MTNTNNKKAFGKITVNATGVTFDNRQGKLWNVYRHTSAGIKALTMLRREPKNEHDPNAIAVLVKVGNTCTKVGYVPADKAVWLAPKMDAGLIVRANNGRVLRPVRNGHNVGFEFTIAHEIAGAVKPAKEPEMMLAY